MLVPSRSSQRRRLVAVWVVLATIAAGMVASWTVWVPASAASAVVTGPLFNKPTGTTSQQNAILSHVGALTNGATSGSRIRIAMYVFGSNWLAEQLVAAKDRGVSVQVIVDDATRKHREGAGAYQILAQGLGTNPAAPSWVLACRPDHACLGKDPDPDDSYFPVNHNKFYLFSKSSGRAADPAQAVPDVVVQSSANLTTWDRKTAWNSAMTVVGNHTLFQAYNSYFEDLRAAALGQIPQTADYPVQVRAWPAKAYFFPRSKTDVILSILNNVDDPVDSSAVCHGNSAGYGTSDGRTVIRVAMHQITRIAVARKLWELDNAGCYVDIVYRYLDENGTAVAAQLTKPTAYGGIALHRLDGVTTTHSKYLLIEGAYSGVANRKIVFTGSHTYTYLALHGNDEALLKYVDPAVHDAYRANFWAQRAAADAA
jgi:phosphatidylserine/phosphatidylglycerophosphate/cardiolipin synthase-like enzyme